MAAAVLLVCGLVLFGCKDSGGGGYTELNGLWEENWSNGVTLNITGETFVFTSPDDESGDVVVAGNFNNLKKISNIFYSADVEVTKVTVGGQNQDLSSLNTAELTADIQLYSDSGHGMGDSIYIQIDGVGTFPQGIMLKISYISGSYTE